MAAFPPPTEPLVPQMKSRTIGEAISRLDKEADKLLAEVRFEHPFHETLADLVERFK